VIYWNHLSDNAYCMINKMNNRYQTKSYLSYKQFDYSMLWICTSPTHLNLSLQPLETHRIKQVHTLIIAPFINLITVGLSYIYRISILYARYIYLLGFFLAILSSTKKHIYSHIARAVDKQINLCSHWYQV